MNHKDENGNTALFKASKKRSVDCLKMLLRGGAHVNAKSSSVPSAMFSALASRNITSIRILLKAGIHVNRLDRQGRNALRYYIASDAQPMQKICKLLYAAGESEEAISIVKTNISTGQRMSKIHWPRIKTEDFMHENELRLENLCRKVIRKSLLRYQIEVRPHKNMFMKVSQLPLPHLMKKYLQYGISLKMEKEDFKLMKGPGHDDDD